MERPNHSVELSASPRGTLWGRGIFDQSSHLRPGHNQEYPRAARAAELDPRATDESAYFRIPGKNSILDDLAWRHPRRDSTAPDPSFEPTRPGGALRSCDSSPGLCGRLVSTPLRGPQRETVITISDNALWTHR